MSQVTLGWQVRPQSAAPDEREGTLSFTSIGAEPGPDLPGMRYIRLIGSGGFADVYQYESERTRGQQLAVKLLKNFGLDEAKLRQFTKEAEVMVYLQHPCIVSVLWTDTAPDGRPYIVMRYYPSRDLAVRASKGPMKVEEALKLGIRLAGAVETAHRAEIIHRDIKPSNVLMSSEGWPALTDFGIAGRFNVAEDASSIAVSVAWSPPEVLEERSDGSAVADVYSLAATIWNLLAGRAPFEIPGESNEPRDMLPRILHSKPLPIERDDIPKSLDRFLRQALEKDPLNRPQSASKFAGYLQLVESELHLPPTEVIILDPPIEIESRTHEHPTSSGELTRRRDGVGTMVSAQDDTAGQTIRKPITLVPHAQNSTATVKRDPKIEKVREHVGPAANTPRRRWSVTLLSILGAAAITIALVVVLAIMHNSKRHSAKSTGSTTTADNDTSNVLPATGTAAADPQPISSKVQGTTVVFTWAAVPGVLHYEWTLLPGNDSQLTTTPRAVVPRASTGPTCILVHSVTPGAPDTPGTRSCAN